MLDQKITSKYKDITNLFYAITNGTITAYDFIKQQNDELHRLFKSGSQYIPTAES